VIETALGPRGRAVAAAEALAFEPIRGTTGPLSRIAAVLAMAGDSDHAFDVVELVLNQRERQIALFQVVSGLARSISPESAVDHMTHVDAPEQKALIRSLVAAALARKGEKERAQSQLKEAARSAGSAEGDRERAGAYAAVAYAMCALGMNEQTIGAWRTQMASARPVGRTEVLTAVEVGADLLAAAHYTGELTAIGQAVVEVDSWWSR